MMKFATLVALLALAYGADSAAMSYEEFTESEVMAEEEPAAYPEEDGHVMEIPLDQYVQQLKEHMEEQASDAESPTEEDSEMAQNFQELETANMADSAHMEYYSCT